MLFDHSFRKASRSREVGDQEGMAVSSLLRGGSRSHTATWRLPIPVEKRG
jgi:hypothetical protein